MPDPLAPLYAGNRAGPGTLTLRPCGCCADPVVFGHSYPRRMPGKEER